VLALRHRKVLEERGIRRPSVADALPHRRMVKSLLKPDKPRGSRIQVGAIKSLDGERYYAREGHPGEPFCHLLRDARLAPITRHCVLAISRAHLAAPAGHEGLFDLRGDLHRRQHPRGLSPRGAQRTSVELDKMGRSAPVQDGRIARWCRWSGIRLDGDVETAHLRKDCTSRSSKSDPCSLTCQPPRDVSP